MAAPAWVPAAAAAARNMLLAPAPVELAAAAPAERATSYGQRAKQAGLAAALPDSNMAMLRSAQVGAAAPAPVPAVATQNVNVPQRAHPLQKTKIRHIAPA